MKQSVSKALLVDFDDLPDNAFVRQAQLLSSSVIPFSAATLWRRVRAGTFPQPVHISPQVTAWRVGEIRLWQKNPGGYVARSAQPYPKTAREGAA